MSLSISLLSAIEPYIAKLANEITQAEVLPTSDEIVEMWTKLIGESAKPAKTTKAPKTQKTEKVKEEVSGEDICSHKFTRGAKSGKTCDSKRYKDYPVCRTHMTKAQKEEADQSEGKEVKAPKAPKEEKKKVVKEPASVHKVNEFGNRVMYKYFIVNDKNQAIGTQNIDGSIAQLCEDDIIQCGRLGLDFIMPETLKDKKILEDGDEGISELEESEEEPSEDEN